jgi:hypothetical protein
VRLEEEQACTADLEGRQHTQRSDSGLQEIPARKRFDVRIAIRSHFWKTTALPLKRRFIVNGLHGM